MKRAIEQEVARVRIDPDAKVVAARDRVTRLEQHITAMGDFKGAKMEALVSALKRAQKDSEELSLGAQIRAREAFIQQDRKRIAQFDEERAAEVQRMEGEKRLEELRALRIAQPAPPFSPPSDASREVACPADGLRIATAVAPRCFCHSISRLSISQSEEGGSPPCHGA